MVMSTCHATLAITAFVIACVMLGYLSLEKLQVFHYNDGEIYDCPVDAT